MSNTKKPKVATPTVKTPAVDKGMTPEEIRLTRQLLGVMVVGNELTGSRITTMIKYFCAAYRRSPAEINALEPLIAPLAEIESGCKAHGFPIDEITPDMGMEVVAAIDSLLLGWVLLVDYADTGICTGVPPVVPLFERETHDQFMREWWETPDMPTTRVAEYNALRLATHAESLRNGVYNSDLIGATVVHAYAMGGPREESAAAIVATVMSELETARNRGEEAADAEEGNDGEEVLGGEPSAPVEVVSPAEQVAETATETVEQVTDACGEALDSIESSIEEARRTTSAVTGSSSGGGGSSSEMSSWAVAGLCVAGLAAAYVGYRLLSPGETEDIIDVDIEDYL